ncbi:MAG: DUF547 domain-containing protein [Pseudomonadales bacterium]|nr:DUF547 domain-containing protein [Pseudomonadales bacterium]
MISLKQRYISSTIKLILSFSMLIFPTLASAAPEPKGIPFWDAHEESNIAVIDHSRWQSLLNRYLISPHQSGVNRFDYANVSALHKKQLNIYLSQLTSLDPRNYSRGEQKAYWINLYNALTVNLIINHYPVKTITKLGKGFFSFGPWDDVITTIQEKELTLNDIEHGILRPIYKDNRIHYAVNCASYSCPNLSQTAYTSENTEALLNAGAHDYVNHSRGVSFDNKQLRVSSIFHWYRVDFGDSDKALLDHLSLYAKPMLAKRLLSYKGEIDHDYNWALNKP